MKSYEVLPSEVTYLRELAKKQLEYAQKPVMEQRAHEWVAHNRCQGERPMVIIEVGSFWQDVKPAPVCQSEAARWLEDQLQQNIFICEHVGDDHVTPDFVLVPHHIEFVLFNLEQKREFAEGGLAYHIIPTLKELTGTVDSLSESRFAYHGAETQALVRFVDETVGGILPPRVKNTINHWAFGITQLVVNLMGMENMFVAMMEEPDAFHALMRRVTDDLKAFLRWQERSGLLLLNNGNDYMGSGSFCFSDELPRAGFGGTVRSTDTWGHVNSQESVGISPKMFEEFMAPYYIEISKEFGLVYYGCCEPVDPFWEHGISSLHNLRKVSISAWCNEQFMAERLAGSTTIYSRKPSPNFLGTHAAFDADAFSESIRTTAELIRGCKSEFIFRDVYKLYGNVGKLRQAVDLVRQLTT